MGVEDLVSSLQKKFGKEVIAGNNQQGVDFISSGSLSLDMALGGGYARGRLIEIRGYESSGKTTLALTACREAQKETGKAVVYIDKENAIDMDYVEALGVDISPDKFLLTQPGTAEECLEIIREVIKSKDVCAVVMDSVAAMFPKCYLEADVGDAKMGVLARLMSAWLPGFVGDVKANNLLLIFINQFREKIGIAYGNPTTTPGGKALGFYTSQVLEVTKAGVIGDKGEETANHVKVKVCKNKVAPPLRKAEFDIRFGEGIDRASEVLQVAIDHKIIEKAGSFYKYQGTNIGQGAERARESLLDNPELLEQIEEEISKVI
jgi:recombination protein RecA|nr:MAG TPA: Protein recA [Herelleviridae sp.]